MNRTSDGRDGMLVWWDAAEVNRSLFVNAMQDSGLGEHLPEAVNKRAALKNVLADAVAQFGLIVPGQRVKYEPLSEDVLGFEAIRVVKGAEANEYPSLFSAALSTTLDGQPKVRLRTKDLKFYVYKKSPLKYSAGERREYLMPYCHKCQGFLSRSINGAASRVC